MIEVSGMAAEVGVEGTVFLSTAVWRTINEVPAGQPQDANHRLKELLSVLKITFKRKKLGDRIDFSVYMDTPSEKKKSIGLKAIRKEERPNYRVITIRLLKGDDEE